MHYVQCVSSHTILALLDEEKDNVVLIYGIGSS